MNHQPSQRCRALPMSVTPHPERASWLRKASPLRSRNWRPSPTLCTAKRSSLPRRRTKQCSHEVPTDEDEVEAKEAKTLKVVLGKSWIHQKPSLGCPSGFEIIVLRWAYQIWGIRTKATYILVGKIMNFPL